MSVNAKMMMRRVKRSPISRVNVTTDDLLTR